MKRKGIPADKPTNGYSAEGSSVYNLHFLCSRNIASIYNTISQHNYTSTNVQPFQKLTFPRSLKKPSSVAL